MSAIFNFLKPLLVEWLMSEDSRTFLVEVLQKLSANTDNTIDDGIVAAVATALGVEVPEKKVD